MSTPQAAPVDNKPQGDKPKKERLITPVGEAKWAHIASPKVFMEHGQPKGEPKYQVDVVFDDKDPAWKTWAKMVMDLFRTLPDQTDKRTGQPITKQPPIKRELDEDDKPTGRYYATFKTGAQYKPTAFDKFGRPLPEGTLIGNGSKVRVNYTLNKYPGFGGGVNFYLNAIQVLELVEYRAQTADAYGFSTEEAPPDNPFNEGPGDPSSDNIPF